ncbi:hypothetical protein N7471_013615, partial [Penicillium samsonianum]|uniref:uncharacterized protein n=1 Tax=Penicillium samsonianum TaxID=1882272 RepID=UPI0025484760
DQLTDIKYQSLGFGKVFAIGFPGRTDKHDAMTMGSSVSGFSIHWMEAVNPDQMLDKSYPSVCLQRYLCFDDMLMIAESWERNRTKPLEVGCWRAHMNVIDFIVSHKIATALIFEDDVDWDVSLKSQLIEFARGARALQNTSDVSISPYGDDWDMLWIGHCAVSTRHDERRVYMIRNDPTVRPESHRGDFYGPKSEFWPDIPPSTRLVFEADYGVCTAGYAITYNAAQKVLAALSMSPLNEPVDLAYGTMCKNKSGFDFHFIAPYPQIVSTWRPAGPSSKDSDIGSIDNSWHKAWSSGIVYSTMLNIRHLISGEESAVAQWDDISPREMTPSGGQNVTRHLIVSNAFQMA